GPAPQSLGTNLRHGTEPALGVPVANSGVRGVKKGARYKFLSCIQAPRQAFKDQSAFWGRLAGTLSWRTSAMKVKQVAGRRGTRKAAFGTALLLTALVSIEGWADQSPQYAPSAKFTAYLAQGYQSVGSLAGRDGDRQLSARYRKRAALAARGV